MADAIVRGEIDGVNKAEFRAVATCRNAIPYGSIRGEIEVSATRREIEYDFRSIYPTRIITRKLGITRYVYVIFRRVTLINRNTGVRIYNARIVLTATKNAAGRRRATLIIYRPGRTTLRASGILEDGRVFVGRNVSCQLLLQ